MENAPVVQKDFEFLVCDRKGFVVLTLDSTGSQTFYFISSLSFKLVLTDNQLGNNASPDISATVIGQGAYQEGVKENSLLSPSSNMAVTYPEYRSYSYPVISNSGCEFCVRKRQGFVVLSNDGPDSSTFYFNHMLGFQMVFTDDRFSLIQQVNQIPLIATHSDLKDPLGRITLPEESSEEDIITHRDKTNEGMLQRCEPISHHEDKEKEVMQQDHRPTSYDCERENQTMQQEFEHTCISHYHEQENAIMKLECEPVLNSQDMKDELMQQEYEPVLEKGCTISASVSETLIMEVEECKPSLEELGLPSHEFSSGKELFHSKAGEEYQGSRDTRMQVSPEETDSASEGKYSENEDFDFVELDLEIEKKERNRSKEKRTSHVNTPTRKTNQRKRPFRHSQARLQNSSIKKYKINDATLSTLKGKMKSSNKGRGGRKVKNKQKASQRCKKSCKTKKNKKGKLGKDKTYKPEEDEEEDDDDDDINVYDENVPDELVYRIKYPRPPKPPEKKGIHPCDECDKVYEYSAQLKQHEQKKHPKPQTCNICNELFQTAFFLRQHNREMHPVKFSCDFCDEMFKNRTLLKRHFKMHHLEVYSCDVCGKKWKSVHSLIIHKKKAHNIINSERALCEQCGKSIKKNLKHHKCKHSHRGNTYKCKICKTDKLHSLAQLHEHLRQEHGSDCGSNRKKIIKQCPDCDLCFLTERELLAHSKAHVSTMCPHSSKTFKNARSLSSPLIFHKKMRSPYIYSCSQCNERFSNSRLLYKHKLREHLKREFSCDDCCRKFNRLEGIKRHMLSHTKEKVHVCKECNKSFSQAYNLRVHMRQHTNEKPFKCEFCSMAFGHKCSLQGHLKKKHNIIFRR